MSDALAEFRPLPPDGGPEAGEHRHHPARVLLADAVDERLLAAIQDGLPLVSRPYAAIGRRAGLSEAEVIDRLRCWIDGGIVKRLGVVVRHRQLGYRANAMVVFDIPDQRLGEVGRRLALATGVTLCYRRPRRGTDWPYNLFCMIHGRDRAKVEARVTEIVAACDLEDYPRAVLFSRRCFKQRGAVYRPEAATGGTGRPPTGDVASIGIPGGGTGPFHSPGTGP